MKYVIAYWLLPAEPALQFFVETIRELAIRFDAPVFDPHLTLFIAPLNCRSPVEVLAEFGEVSINLSTAGVGFSEQFTKTLFVQFEKSDPLQKLSDRISELSGATEPSILDPHVSLLYRHLASPAKRQLAASINLRFTKVTFKGFGVVRCASPTKTADDVRAWQLLATTRRKTCLGVWEKHLYTSSLRLI